MAGRVQNPSLRKFLKNVWEKAMIDSIVFDFSNEEGLKELKLYNLRTALYNYRKFVRLHRKQSEALAQEWEKLRKLSITQINPTKLVIHEKLIMRPEVKHVNLTAKVHERFDEF